MGGGRATYQGWWKHAHHLSKDWSHMNPMDEIAKLRDAVDKALEDLDIERMTFTIIPGEDGQQDTLGMIFKVHPRALMSAEQRNIDSTFEELMSGMIEPDKGKDRLDDVKKMISDWMDDEDEGSTSE